MAEEHNPLVMTEEQKRRMRRRNVAIGLVLFALVVIFYALAVVKGPGFLNRPM
jgi:accessory gene regulator protein AgrB